MSEETISLLGDAGNTSGIDRMATEGQTPEHEEHADLMDEDEPEPEPLSSDEIKTRRSLVRRLARYKAVFPLETAELRDELEGLPHKSPEELTTLLEEVQFLVETRRSTVQARGLFLTGLTMGEAAGPYVGLKLQGLTQIARQSDDLLRSVDECALKYEEVVRLDPAARLAMCVGQLALAVDGANRARETGASKPAVPSDMPSDMPPPVEQQPTNIIRDKYSDL
jgi:hypothetical protein